MGQAPDIWLTVCRSCGAGTASGGGPALAAALAPVAAQAGAGLRSVECLGACAAPLAMALSSAGRAAYLFGDLDPESNARDVGALLVAYGGASGGWIDDARPLGRLRHCLRGRVPAEGAGLILIPPA